MTPASRPPSTRRILVVAPQSFYQDRGSPIALRHVLTALAETVEEFVKKLAASQPSSSW